MKSRSRFRGKKKGGSEYVRATAMFKVDEDYLPKGAKYALRGRASGEFAEQVAEVVEKAMKRGHDIAFSLTKWKGDENAVLSVGAVEPKEGGKRRRRRDEDEDEPRGKRRGRSRDRDEDEDKDDDRDEQDDEPDNDDDVNF